MFRGEISKCVSLPGISPHPPLHYGLPKHIFFPKEEKKEKVFSQSPVGKYPAPLPLPSLFLASKKRAVLEREMERRKMTPYTFFPLSSAFSSSSSSASLFFFPCENQVSLFVPPALKETGWLRSFRSLTLFVPLPPLARRMAFFSYIHVLPSKASLPPGKGTAGFQACQKKGKEKMRQSESEKDISLFLPT